MWGSLRSLRPSSVRVRESDARWDGSLVGKDGRAVPGDAPLSQVEPVRPANGAPARYSVFAVNGIMTDRSRHAGDLQALADTGCEVYGIHNATEGMARDLWQCFKEKLGFGQKSSPVVSSILTRVRDATAKGEDIHLVGHSQGALLVSTALRRLSREWKAQGLSPREIQSRLRHVYVETYGGAAFRFPNGPHYTHYVNQLDAVPMLSGVGLPLARKGQGAVVVKFRNFKKPGKLDLSQGLANALARSSDQSTHGPREIYFPHRASSVDAFDAVEA